MKRILRRDSGGVASAVAAMFMLVIILLFIQATILTVVPVQQGNAEYATSEAALHSLSLLRTIVFGPVVPATSVVVPISLGTAAVSPFSTASDGHLSFGGGDTAGLTASFRFVPQVRAATVTKVNQDVILVMDSSGSMAWNDPNRLRISGAKEYVATLTRPDRVAIVDFNGQAYLTRQNVGGTAHHLNYPGHDGVPDYSDPQADLDTIGATDGTNIGAALQVANNELIGYGDRTHAWVEILLTDGQNNYAWQDALTLSEAGRAKANNITIYTIGLSNQADAALLTQVASLTGGTYYSAPTASSIRWIYYEISMHYQSSLVCGTLAGADGVGGALSLELHNRYYPPQTIRLESGGVALVQTDGAVLRQGVPLAYAGSGRGSGTLTLPFLQLTGVPFDASGTDYRFLEARILSQELVDQPITTVNLTEEARAVGNVSAYVAYWGNQGAATPTAVAAVQAPIDGAQASVVRAETNASMGNFVGARFDVDRAQTQLSDAIVRAEAQRASKGMQNWLAKSTEDQVRWESCRLSQWGNWYDGITLTVTSPLASAWANWFNQTLRDAGSAFSIAASGGTVVVTIHSIDRIVTDRRVVELSVT